MIGSVLKGGYLYSYKPRILGSSQHIYNDFKNFYPFLKPEKKLITLTLYIFYVLFL